MELAPVGRVSALPGRVCQLLFAICQVSSYPGCSLGELPAFRDRRRVSVCRPETHLRPTAAVSRKDRGPNSGYSKPSRCGLFLFRCLLSDQAFTGLPPTAARRAEGPGIRAAGYQQSAGFALQPTFQSNVALTHAAQRSSARLLSGLLVTVLQLRVTGYRKAPGGN